MIDTELMIYLWLFPMVFFIVVFMLILSLGVFRNWFSSQKSPVLLLESPMVEEQPGYIASDRRVHQRAEPQGFVAHISDGTNCIKGTVRDISGPGICLAGPANILDKGAKNLGVLVTGNGERVQLLVKPKWKHHQGDTQVIGGLVAENLEGWRDFTLQFEGV